MNNPKEKMDLREKVMHSVWKISCELLTPFLFSSLESLCYLNKLKIILLFVKNLKIN